MESHRLAPVVPLGYPKAKVIWCHIAQVRYIERASRYTPAYVDQNHRNFLRRLPVKTQHQMAYRSA
jgi:hypothetical protein